MNDARAARPPLDRDGADRALARLRDEQERIGAALLELEAHQGYRLLDGAALDGGTRRVQAEVRARMAEVWALFDRYGRTLAEAERLRARHSRPDRAQLAELTRLLAGPSVELPAEEVPLERRTLLAAPSGEKLTLQEVVARMTPLYEDVAKTVAALDTVWSALLARLAEAEAEQRAAAGLLASLGGTDPDLERLTAELAAMAAVVRGDPLALASGGRADTGRLDTLRTALADVRRDLEEAQRLREGFADRIAGIASVLDALRAAEAEARRARDEVLAKIASPVLPDLPDMSATLADRLAAVGHPPPGAAARAGGWNDLAGRVADLDRAMRAALDRARRDAEVIRGLLDRREELRGRLEAYRAKAARLGGAEDAELAAIYERARELLWTSPCDLREATVTLSGYQQAITSRVKGAQR
ncbi:hypothetical protein F8568_003615 [Actinomadura sp. LD22]|uniref:Uncharacterized protein n=1 Tax=Actinomadura physcomitrii TaxID=2650748 RepID=A0A6I4M0R0_9ACTN|nr:hypothetical protein [Actinomadura physcomitrii]MVZ99477.1 hypothetical protein [Actinomadura physcomitrii]